MKILFYGRTRGNSGPENVNRDFYAHLTDSFLPAAQGRSLRALAGDFGKLLGCDTLVVSGLSRKGCLLTAAAGLLGKKRVYILHGCARWEQAVNGMENTAPIKQEQYLMKHCHLVLTVSRQYRDFLTEYWPKYAEKLGFLNPGLPELPDLGEWEKIPGTILAAGADRPLKNNLPLAKAVEALNGTFRLEICGAACRGNPFEDFSHSQYLGLLPREEYWKKLRQTEIFVVNSTRESFGISPLEALRCGCSLLVSENTGVRDLLNLEERDIIHDPLDTEELKNKLQWIHAHPNHTRLRAKTWAWEDALLELQRLCGEGGTP